MLYIYTPADGKNTEGIGAMAQYQIHTQNLCQAIVGARFLGRDFTNLQHYQGYSTQEEFCRECTEFFNFPNRVEIPDAEVVKFDNFTPEFEEFVEKYQNSKEVKIIEINNFALMPWADSNIKWWGKENIFEPLVPYMQFDPTKYYIDENKLNVSMHIRNFMPDRDNDHSITREYYEPGGEKEKYFINLMTNIDGAFEFDKEFHIYSQGEEVWFDNFLNQGYKVNLHINEHPLTSLYHMIKCDIRVMSNSSMSYLAALYGQGLSIARDNFPHATLNTVYTDRDGKFDTSLVSVESK